MTKRKSKTVATGKGKSGCASVNGSAALLGIIKACEEYQNEDAEGMSLETQCDNGYRCSMKVITIASAALQELEARQNGRDQRPGQEARELKP